MNKRLAVSLVAASLLTSGAAFAQSTTQQGAANGAAAGGDVAGPVGEVVGGTVGAAVGLGLEIPNAVITSVTAERAPSVTVRERVVVGEPLPDGRRAAAGAEPYRISLCCRQRSPRDRGAAHAQGHQDYRLIIGIID